jgi:multidrug transporter EmrE-like cation transporter
VGYLLLTVAIAAQVGATVALRMSSGFGRPLLGVVLNAPRVAEAGA